MRTKKIGSLALWRTKPKTRPKMISIKLQKLWGIGIKGSIYKRLVGTGTWGSFQKLKSINIGVKQCCVIMYFYEETLILVLKIY